MRLFPFATIYYTIYLEDYRRENALPTVRTTCLLAKYYSKDWPICQNWQNRFEERMLGNMLVWVPVA